MSELVPFEDHGFILNGFFADIRTPRPGPAPAPESPYQVLPPFYQPYAHTSFWKTPVGSGAVYLSTSDIRHTDTFDSAGMSVNYSNWTERVFYASESDPICEIRHYQSMPNGWAQYGNTDIAPTTTTGAGVLRNVFSGIRLPNEAKWYSTTNTDRKMICVMDFDCSLTWAVHNSVTGALVSSTTEFFPRGTLSVEVHNFMRTSGNGGGGANTLIYCSNLSRSDLRTHGGGYGALASGVAMTNGYIRKWEADAAIAGDVTAIRHALKVGLPGRKLKVGQIYPASNQDGNTEGYEGHNPMGSFFVLDKDTNINALTLSNLGRAVAWTLQNFGAYALIRAGGGPIVFGVETEPPFISSGNANALASDLSNVLRPHMRIVTNSNPFPSGTREPPNPALLAGGGTRITAGKGYSGFDNDTGLMRPINPDPESWHIAS